MASIWSGARSNITGRAESSAPARRSRTRSSAVSRGPGRFTPNLRATQIELYDGLSASSQNRWPSLAFDVGAVNDLLSPLFAAGFYYKTFMGPNLFGKNWAWTHVYEPTIRRAAGLGVAPARARSRPLSADVRPLRRADRRRRPGRVSPRRWRRAQAARASSCATSNPALGGSLLAETDARIETMPRARLAGESGRGASRSAQRAPDDAHAGVRLLRAELRRPERAHHRGRPASPIPTCRASAYGRCARARSCWRPARSSARWCSRTTTARA